MKYLLDEDVNPTVAGIGRGIGLDIVSIHDLKERRGLADDEQLAFAAAEHRVLISRNRDDFLVLVRLWFRSNRVHSGVVIVPYTLPNNRPALIANALRRWHDRGARANDPEASFLDFLSARDATPRDP